MVFILGNAGLSRLLNSLFLLDNDSGAVLFPCIVVEAAELAALLPSNFFVILSSNKSCFFDIIHTLFNSAPKSCYLLLDFMHKVFGYNFKHWPH